MAYPKPQGIQARFQNSWVYLTIPRIPGYGVEVEAYQNGTWEPIAKWGSEFPVALYADPSIRTEWRARYTRSGAGGEWRTGRAWSPDNFEEDGDAPTPKPPKPEGFRPFHISGDWTSFTASPAPGVDTVRVAVGHTSDDLPVRGLSQRRFPTKVYAEQVAEARTVDSGGNLSDPVTARFHTTKRTDGHPGPVDPETVRVIDVTGTSAVVSWSQPDPRGVQYWQGGINTRPMETVHEQQLTITGLEPDTAYEGGVMARGHDQAYSPSLVPFSFTTSGDTPPTPEPKQPTGLKVVSKDVPAGSATVGWAQASDAEFWRVRLATAGGRWRTVRSNQAVFTGLTEGTRYGWEVKAVATDAEGYEYESPAVSSSFTFEGENPPPVPIPKPTGLRTHCITTSSAIVEWERAANVDGWEVWIDDRSNAQFTEATRHNVRGLRPNTSYTVSVVARKGDGESEVATDTFVTLAENEIEGDLPTPTGLHLESPRPGVLSATWDGQVPPFVPQGRTDDAFYVSCDGLTTTTQTDRNGHEWTGLASGEYVVEVYRATGGAVSGIARLAASVKGARW